MLEIIPCEFALSLVLTSRKIADSGSRQDDYVKDDCSTSELFCFSFTDELVGDAPNWMLWGAEGLDQERVKMLHLDHHPLDRFGLTLAFEFYWNHYWNS